MLVTGENNTMRSFITCTIHLMKPRRMRHALLKHVYGKCIDNFCQETSRKETTWEMKMWDNVKMNL
jgi:hypothetical protein